MTSVRAGRCAFLIGWIVLVLLWSVVSSECARMRSKQARNAVKTWLVPKLLQKQDELPQDCVLREEWDVLLPQERTKVARGGGEWECGLCGKRFTRELFLDKHLEFRHTQIDEHPQSGAKSFCLADLCGVVLSCGVPPVREFLGGREVDVEQNAPPPAWCSDREEIAARKRTCLAILRRCTTESFRLPTLQMEICDRAPEEQCRTERSPRHLSATYTFIESSNDNLNSRERTALETVRLTFGIISLVLLTLIAIVVTIFYRESRTAADLHVPLRIRLRHWILPRQKRN